jgi:hypothetical protein
MTAEINEAIRKATVDTLRTIACWLTEDDERMLRRVAEAVEHQPPADWLSCPVCEEIECDGGCPLGPLRKVADGG